MKLSIITINYNNAQGLEKTIKSIVSQSFEDFEYIIIDGNSSDGSKDVIEKHADKIDYWVSEPDSGIYNAMNKGIRQAKGEYLLFINSGDSLYENTTLNKVFSVRANTDIIYGDLHRVFPNGFTDVVPMPECVSIHYLLSATLCHPVTFIKRVLFQKYGFYREDLKIVSDWAFFLKIIALGRISQKHVSTIIATFTMDGISSKQENAITIMKEKEKVIHDNFSCELQDILSLYLKYNKFYNKKIFVFIRRLRSLLYSVFHLNSWKGYIHKHRIKPLIFLFNKTVREQKKDIYSIPIIIINYNRLKYLKELVEFLLIKGHKNIVIVDNNSTYPPLLEYYQTIKDTVTIEFMDYNYGHLVFWYNNQLFNKYSSGYYVVTDSDIIPNKDLSENYLSKMMEILDANKNIVKVGFALKIDDIPDTNKQKEQIISWERLYWTDLIGTDMYRADIDTTFALYPPGYRLLSKSFYYNGIRLAGSFTARHMGWYIDNDNLTEEERYYFKMVGESSSWRLDENGNFIGKEDYK